MDIDPCHQIDIEENIGHAFKRHFASMETALNAVTLSTQETERYHYLMHVFPDISLSEEKQRAHFIRLFPEYGLISASQPYVYLRHMEADNACSLGKQGLSSEERKCYQANGFIQPFKLKQFTQEAQQKLENKILKDKHFNLKRDIDVLKLALNQELTTKIASLLGASVVLVHFSLHLVTPRLSEPVAQRYLPPPPHSDVNGAILADQVMSGAPSDDPGFINAWVSINGASLEKAPLYLFPGTHLWPVITPAMRLHFLKDRKREKREFCAKVMSFYNGRLKNSLYGRGSEFRPGVDYQILSAIYNQDKLNTMKNIIYDTKAGDCIIFSGHCLHGAVLNHTNLPRIALSFRYRRADHTPLDYFFSRFNNKNFTNTELQTLGISEQAFDASVKTPILQVSGNTHHPKYYPIDGDTLIHLLEETT